MTTYNLERISNQTETVQPLGLMILAERTSDGQDRKINLGDITSALIDDINTNSNDIVTNSNLISALEAEITANSEAIVTNTINILNNTLAVDALPTTYALLNGLNTEEFSASLFRTVFGISVGDSGTIKNESASGSNQIFGGTDGAVLQLFGEAHVSRPNEAELTAALLHMGVSLPDKGIEVEYAAGSQKSKLVGSGFIIESLFSGIGNLTPGSVFEIALRNAGDTATEAKINFAELLATIYTDLNVQGETETDTLLVTGLSTLARIAASSASAAHTVDNIGAEQIRFGGMNMGVDNYLTIYRDMVRRFLIQVKSDEVIFSTETGRLTMNDTLGLEVVPVGVPATETDAGPLRVTTIGTVYRT